MKNNWDNILNRFKNARVMVVGDVMIDRYLNGRVERISPEAPVPILRHSDTIEKPGGAANVALNLKALECDVFLLSVVGDDINASILKAQLDQAGLASELIKSASRKTTVKTRILSNNDHLLRVDFEDTHAISQDTDTKLLSELEKQMESFRPELLILQDYNKGVLHKANINTLISLAKKHGCFVAVDPKINDFFEYQGVDFLKPNLKEAQIALEHPIDISNAGLLSASAELLDRLSVQCVMITLSEHGVYINDGKDQLWTKPSKREIVDVCGAGDAVLAAGPLAFLFGYDLSVVNRLTNVVGGQVCESPGVVTIDKKSLLNELTQGL